MVSKPGLLTGDSRSYRAFHSSSLRCLTRKLVPPNSQFESTIFASSRAAEAHRRRSRTRCGDEKRRRNDRGGPNATPLLLNVFSYPRNGPMKYERAFGDHPITIRTRCVAASLTRGIKG